MQTNIKPNILKSIQILLCSLFIQTAVFAAGVGSAFSYQGQLLNQGQPTNQKHDIRILAYHQKSGGAVQMEAEFFDVEVTDGMFSIPEVDLGDSLFQGDEVWLELEVRQAGGGPYEVLQPRQRVSAAPYAIQSAYAVEASLAVQAQNAIQALNAASAEQAQNAVHAQNATQADTLAGNGANNNDVLQFDGQNWVPQALTLDPYWSTHSSNPNDIHFNGGDVGIGSIYPSAKLHVFGAGGDEAFIVNVGNQSKLMVHENGGLSVGTSMAAPNDGLRVQGNIQLQGDTKQPLASNGMMKFMVKAVCAGSSSGLIHSYNGVDSQQITVSERTETGMCNIHFPYNISERYWQVSTISSEFDKEVVACQPYTIQVLSCSVYKANTGSKQDGVVMVLVY